jgi:putative hemolysin
VTEFLDIIAVLALIAGNAFFVIGEYSVVTARRSSLQPRADAGSAGARAALRLMEDPVRVISTVQVGITAIGILTGAIGEPLVRGLLGGAVPEWLSFVIAFSTVTYLSVVLGELVPKALTLQKAEALAALVSRPIEFLSKVLRPIVWVLQSSGALLLRPFGITDVVAGDSIRTADELRALVDEAEGAGVIPRAQEELLHNVFDFADREVRDIMVPALDVVWLDAELTCEEALDRVVEAPHGRYPVGRGDLDHLAGVVHVRDMIIGSRRSPGASLEELARRAYVVPESKDLGPLLRELREQREQLAVVVDEYGAVAGIVTLEDVIEELVGDIQDEFDLPDSRITRIDDRTLRVAGSMTIDDFNEAVGTNLPQRAARTLAGLVFDALGRRPKQGDTIAFGDVELCVLTVEGLRITEVEVRLPEPVEAEEPGVAGGEAAAPPG